MMNVNNMLCEFKILWNYYFKGFSVIYYSTAGYTADGGIRGFTVAQSLL